MDRPSAVAEFGSWLMAAAAAAGLGLSIYNYLFNQGIHGTWGALLVVASTALVLIAALLLALDAIGWRWLRIIFDVLLFLGMVGTGFAAWFLEAYLLDAFMAVGLIGWFVYLVGGRRAGGVRPVQAHAEAVP